ncbi:MAG: AAA family ATPase, partial [Selenomonadaceae bacterium]|nr:AAA family ATPase [Selenomonadaceae bacterium]
MQRFKETLSGYFDASLPIIFVDSFEEEKIVDAVREICSGRGLLEWNVRGICDLDNHVKLLEQSLAEALEFFLNDTSNLNGKVLFIKGFQYHSQEEAVSERLKILAQLINSGAIPDFTIIIISPVIDVPTSLEHFVTILNLESLTNDEIKSVILDFISDYGLPAPNVSFLDELVSLFKGLHETDIKAVLGLALSADGELNHSDLSLVFEQKQQLIKKTAILDLIHNPETIDSLGGLDNLKDWLKRKALVVKNISQARQFGVDTPKGVLICGMPGCGKSLSAKATASLFGFPLIRLDMGKLMGKYVGESEANMRRAINLAEASSPCVLWIDELEKAFAGIGTQGTASEVTTRLFGHFLTWLQEKDSLAFVVATANNISILPPELLRKGRFDEIFYVDLPNEQERSKIFEIHINKRRPNDFANIDIKALVEKTKGYSGA